jgi:tetratricopeptide (TPR) repeat protein
MGIDLQEVGERTAEMSKDRLALDYDLKAQNIFQSLSTADPTNTFHMRDAADAGLFIGRTRLSLGDTVGAVEVFRQIISTYKALVDADPLNRSARFELADAFNYTGQALAKNRDLNGALTYCRQAQAILRALSENHSERDDRIKLIQIDEVIGGLLETIGDKEGAIANYREALAMLEGLSAAEPGNKTTCQSTALEHANIARVYATIAADSSDQKQRDSWAEARACYQRSLKIWEELRAQNSLGPTDETHYTEVIQEIKKCDVALAKP